MIDMSERKVYSKMMKQHLEIVDRDGLPGIRLLPGDHGGDAIALRTEQCNTSEEEIEDEGERGRRQGQDRGGGHHGLDQTG